jgi:hypothetical protein
MSTRPLPTREELLELSDLTLAGYVRYPARWGGAVRDEDRLVLFAGPHRQPNPCRNGVLRLDPAIPVDEPRRRAAAFFGPRKSGYALWAREDRDGDLDAFAAQAGLRELERLPQLVLTELPEYKPAPEGVEIRRAADQRAREDHLDLAANAWGMAGLPREVAARMFFRPRKPHRPQRSGVRRLLRRAAGVGGDGARQPRRGAGLPGRHDPPSRAGAEAARARAPRSDPEPRGELLLRRARARLRRTRGDDLRWPDLTPRRPGLGGDRLPPVHPVRTLPRAHAAGGAMSPRIMGDAAVPPRPDPLDNEQRALKRNVAEFARDVIDRDLERRDREAEFSAELWRRCAELGIQGLPVPTEHGGLGASAVTTAAALQGFGYGSADNGLIFALNAHMWACETPIIKFGTEEQKRRYLPSMCDGTLIAAHAMTEPDSKTFASNAPDSGTDLDVAMTKLHLSESLVQSSLDALQIHGGSGYMTETGLERDVRDAIGARIYSGTSDLQRNVIEAQLGL